MFFCFAFFAFQMSFGQSCNVVTNPTFTGNSTGWTLGGSGTGWYYEATWAPNEIYIEKDGAVNQSLKQTLGGLISNTLTLSFKIKGQNANRLSSCPTTAQLDIKIGGVTYMTILNPVSNSQITTANVSTFNGATYTQTGFPLTVGGATSATAITQGAITLTIPWVPATATTGDLEFVANTSNTTSISPTVCLAWGGDDWFLDDIVLYANNPTTYNMTGSSVCAGTATTVGLSGSQLGVNYQLYLNGSTAVGSSVAGTGAAISFGSQTVTGVYTAVATAGITSCTTPMNGSVSINPNPTLTGASQPASQPAACAGSGAIISLTGLLPSTTSTINYTINGVAQTAIPNVVSDVSGAGSFTTPVLTLANNGQILQITGVTNTSATPNCTTNFARNVTLAVNPTPTLTGASQPVAACVGSGAVINLTGLLASTTSTINYTINGVAQTAVTGVASDVSGAASFSTVALTAANNNQILQVTGVTTTSATPNCSASFTQNVTLSVTPSPTISTAAATAVVTAACQSASVQTTTMAYTATTLSPTSYSIDWLTLADQSSTAFSFVAGAGTVTGIIIPAGTPSGTYTGTMTVSSVNGCTGTKAITLTINASLTASVSISSSPAGTVCAGTSVTFTATPTNPGTTPVYQWKLNGVNVGTNSTTYASSTLLLNNDVITCEMTSNATPCLTGSPATSNAITVASAGPTTTGVTICAGGSGSLSSSYNCTNSSTQTASNSGGTSNATTYGGSGNTNISINFPALPAGATVTNISTIITYTSNNPSWTNELRIEATPPVALGAVQSDLQASSTSSSAGTITNSAFGTWGTASPVGTWSFRFRETTNDNGVNPDANISNISIVVSYTVAGSINWYTASTGGTLLGSGSSFNPVGVSGSGLANTNTAGSTIFYAACSNNTGCRTPVAFVINATPTATISGTTAVCQGGSTPNITFTNPLSSAITVTYNINGGTNTTVNVGASTTATVAVPTGTSGTFIYNLVSAVYQTAPTCSASLTGSATVTVRPTVTATISGTTSVCQGASTPNITFTNPLSEAITVTYNINGGTNTTVNVGASTTATVAVPTGTSGTFVYNLVSAVYQTAPTCSASLTGSATVTVRPTVTATISGTTSVCQGASTPNITFTNPLSEAITVTYNINGGTNTTVNVGASTTATVAVPTGTSGTFVYNLVSAVYQTAPTCSASLTGSATVTVRPTVTASISGTTSVCQGASTPNITFTNPLSEAITVTYNINGGTNTTVNVGASTTATVAVPTGTSGTFVYNLVSAVYQTAPTCSASLTGSATVTVRPTVTASISGTTSVCQGASTPNITFTNPLSEAITVTYNINGGTNSTVNVGASTTATVAVPTGTSGTFVYNLVSAVYQTAPTCSASLTGSATVTVRPTVTASISGTTSVCQGASTPNVTFTNPLSSAITVTYNINGGTNTTVNVGASTTATVAVPTGTSGTFVYNLVSAVYQTAPTCSASLTGSATVTVQSIPSAPTVGTVTHISCTTNTGNVVLNNLPSSGSWTITSTPATVITTGSGTSTTISGLAIGGYTFTVTNAGGCPSAASSAVDIFDYTSTTWNGSGWSNGVPNASKNIIIDSVTPNSPFTADLQGCALTINNGVIATVSSGITLTITNGVTTNGQLIFENNSSLVQINDVANSGSIVYKRISYPMKNFDATYWSSPVFGQTLVDLSPNTLSDKYIAYYNSAWKTEARTNVMKPGIGYAIRVPKPNYWPIPTATTYAQPVEFKGVPNNGNITSSQAITAGKYYLIGNPYPSALDARKFLFTNANNNAVLNGTIYFWTHNTGISPSGGKYVYSSNDYASFNATGGTATTGANNAIPSGYIAAGQSFMASAKANGTVQFDNSMRVGGADNAQFFKPGKTSKAAELESHRLWLNMTNSGGAFKQTLIGYVTGATNSYDVNFDGETFDGNTYIDFYSVNTTNKLTIQGRALPFTNTDLVPLGYRSTIAGDFTISIDKADGNLASQRVYLEDKQTGTINELTAGNYVFTTKAGTFNDRFVLRYSSNTLGTGDFETADDAVWVKIANKTISVNATSENIDKVIIYDLSGKQLYAKEDVNNLQLLIENLPFAQQVLLVKVVLDNGYQTTKKVVFN